MSFVVDDAHHGTEENVWLSAFEKSTTVEWAWGTPRRVVILAPHPDDEVLALGGSLMRLARRRCRVDVIAVTQGERSHPRSRRRSPQEIAHLRRDERSSALAALGLSGARVTELAVPDGRVASETKLVDRIAPLIAGATYCIAPWQRDGHPDHDATGAAAAAACKATGVRLLEYVIWAWHWADPSAPDFPWSRLRKVSLRSDEHAAKIAAIEAYRSQIRPLATDEPEVILPPSVLARFQRSFEAVLL